MQLRRLGRTDLRVSALSLGTVALGGEYGLRGPGTAGRPDPATARGVVREALESGINLFDTAPAYGEAEEILSRALDGCPQALVCSKVAVPRDPSGRPARGRALRRQVDRSLRGSLQRLRREVIDILQIHNATSDVLDDGEMVDCLLRARERGEIRAIGASVYTEEEARRVIASGAFDSLQVPYSMLDQKMACEVIPRASARGVGVITRSVLLKGALSGRARWLPADLLELRHAVERAREALGISWRELPATALRFCLSRPGIATTLIGAQTPAEVRQAVRALDAGPLDSAQARIAACLGLRDQALVNPALWPCP